MKFVYAFSKQLTEGRAAMRDLLGGKGANLAEMASLGLPVPPGFTITTEACREYIRIGGQFPAGLWEEVLDHLNRVEALMGKRFGDENDPLLFSCRSGAKFSMPGMMDTVLNIGLNDRSVGGCARQMNNERGAWDSYRRLLQMFGDVVLGVEHDHFEHRLQALKDRRGVHFDTDLTVEDLQELAGEYKALILQDTGAPFPQDPEEQLQKAVEAVFKSWMNPRAVTYRRINKIAEDLGTAVNIQTMVFGNLGETSGTGVAFTRNPASGERKFYGEFLMNAQGEDVVAGIRTPKPLLELERTLPSAYNELIAIFESLENHYQDMQDVEFTIQEGKLYMLQTRTGKRTGFAAVRIAVEMVEEGLIDKANALRRVEGEHLDQYLHEVFPDFVAIQKEEAAGATVADLAKKHHLAESQIRTCLDARNVAKGLNASPGAASGRIVFNAEDAIAWAGRGEKVILVRIETSPEDIGGMHVARGILTARGGLTSHAAVVARGQGKCCVAGCGDLRISYGKKVMEVAGLTLKEGDSISINGTTGDVIAGALPTRPSEILQVLTGELDAAASKEYHWYERLMTWADEYRRMRVRTNAETAADTFMALKFGAEGIGLCRTEHMFFGEDRIFSFRKMILAENEAGRRKALDEILPYQRQDFYDILKLMAGKPVTIRLLDPPLHEFLPHETVLQEELAAEMGVSADKIHSKVESLMEANPMMGHRGCRLGMSYPEIPEMQARAIFEAVVQLKKEGVEVHPEVMIPLVGMVREFTFHKEIVDRVAAVVKQESGVEFEYLTGTMIEIPRAVLMADKIAEQAEFFSFGTNDLTQMTLGFSRDDVGKFLPKYVESKVLPDDPFAVLDFEGVGQLVRMGTERGRSTRPKLKVGICGEHGGNPPSVEFCHDVGMDYVSCSPFRVPIARLHAAKAVLKKEEGDK